MTDNGTPHLRRNALLAATHLVKTFKAKGGRVQALSDVSLDVMPGETLGVVGESGSGKSTLARAILALEKPDSGAVMFEGGDLLQAQPREMRLLRRRIQMVFQDPLSSLNPAHRIRDIVEMPLLVVGQARAAERQRLVAEALRNVGLDYDVVADRKPYELSGGQCQRVSLARALILRPGLLVCDEPVSALDVSIQAQILNLLEDAKASFSLTMVFISHDLAVVKAISDRVLVLYLGKVCEVGSTVELYAAPKHPYTSTLLASVPTLEVRQRKSPDMAVRGETPSPLDVPSGCRFRTRCPRATARCSDEVPALTQIGTTDHFVACHHPLPDHPR